MNRIMLIQAIINKKKMSRYLEIGASGGKTFFRIKARRKTAVDPKFHFHNAHKVFGVFKNFCNIRNRYFEITSDAYFSQKSELLLKTGLDVVLIDGLHSYKQALLDVENALKYLNPGGVIIMHDCNPATEAMACPADSPEQAQSYHLPGWTGAWCGDVWKTICHLRTNHDDLHVFVFDCDHGLGVVTKGRPEKPLELTTEQIGHLTYMDLEKNRDEYLNLKKADYFNSFINPSG